MPNQIEESTKENLAKSIRDILDGGVVDTDFIFKGVPEKKHLKAIHYNDLKSIKVGELLKIYALLGGRVILEHDTQPKRPSVTVSIDSKKHYAERMVKELCAAIAYQQKHAFHMDVLRLSRATGVSDFTLVRVTQGMVTPQYPLVRLLNILSKCRGSFDLRIEFPGYTRLLAMYNQTDTEKVLDHVWDYLEHITQKKYLSTKDMHKSTKIALSQCVAIRGSSKVRVSLTTLLENAQAMGANVQLTINTSKHKETL